ncbi:FAD:protein FMN transferase [Microbacterium oryzae]|uniref:FAD:protein FMN transferase n=1 Tax=Microbacterium oryzae TaxID=743009 RepID=A0A6I6E3P3_9MICO|nr:FAD:protein FMN transferase [Microbacterium oryzae]QGU26431.1 FAD:protein FMN transferase [Microbacterium oryzae]
MPAVWRFDAIGTMWDIETPGPLGDRARGLVAREVETFDAAWSRFRPDSLVTALAREGGDAPAPEDAAPMLDLYLELSRETGGAVNPLVGASLERLGYDAAYRLAAEAPISAPADWRARLRWTGGRLALDGPGVIDVGALGKGRLVDRVAALLPDATTVDASGDILVRGAPQRIALEHPHDARRAIGVVTVADEALCASAANRRAWGDGLHHVLDARTGEPVRTVVATWAIARTAMLADAAATALFFEGGERFAHAHDVHWVRMLTDGRAEWSLGSRLERGEAELFR